MSKNHSLVPEGLFAWVFLQHLCRNVHQIMKKPRRGGICVACWFRMCLFLRFQQCCRLGRAERKKKMWVFQIGVKPDLSSYPLKDSAKPNFIPLELPALQNKSVGFHSVSGWCGMYGEIWFFYCFSRFWWHSFYPTYDAVRQSFLKLTSIKYAPTSSWFCR